MRLFTEFVRSWDKAVYLRVGECISPLYPCSGYKICKVDSQTYVISTEDDSVTLKEPNGLSESIAIHGVIFCSYSPGKCVLVSSDCKLHTGPYADPVVGMTGSGEALVFDGSGVVKAKDAVVATRSRRPVDNTFVALAKLETGKALALVRESELYPGLVVPVKNGDSLDLDKIRNSVVSPNGVRIHTVDNIYIDVSVADSSSERYFERVIAFTSWPAEVSISDSKSKVPVKLRKGIVRVDYSKIWRELAVIVGYPVFGIDTPVFTVGWLLAELSEDGRKLIITDGGTTSEHDLPDTSVLMKISSLGVVPEDVEDELKELKGSRVAELHVAHNESRDSWCYVQIDEPYDVKCTEHSVRIDEYDNLVDAVPVYGAGIPRPLHKKGKSWIGFLYDIVYAKQVDNSKIRSVSLFKPVGRLIGDASLREHAVALLDMAIVSAYWAGSGELELLMDKNGVREMVDGSFKILVSDAGGERLLALPNTDACKVEPVTIFAYKIDNKLGTPYELPELLKECCEECRCSLMLYPDKLAGIRLLEGITGMIPYVVVSEFEPTRNEDGMAVLEL